eukprot:1211183-Amphidinium_carterae.1
MISPSVCFRRLRQPIRRGDKGNRQGVRASSLSEEDLKCIASCLVAVLDHSWISLCRGVAVSVLLQLSVLVNIL